MKRTVVLTVAVPIDVPDHECWGNKDCPACNEKAGEYFYAATITGETDGPVAFMGQVLRVEVAR